MTGSPRIPRPWRLAAGAAALFLALGLPRAGALEIREVHLGPGVEHVQWGRSGADALLDIFVLAAGRVRVWEQGAGGFTPSAEIELPAEAGLVDFGDIAGDERDEIVLLNRQGISIWDGGAPGPSREGSGGADEVKDKDGPPPRGFRRLISVPGIPSPLDTAHASVLEDLTGDGKLDLIVPVRRGYEVFQRRGEKLEKNVSLEGEHRVEVDCGGPEILDPLEFDVRIARLKFKDLNGDGLLDIVARRGDTTHCYLQGSSGFPPSPTYELDLSRFAGEDRKNRSPGPLAGGSGVKAHEVDIDADGVQDYLIASGQFLRVYFGSRAGTDFTRPHTMLKLSSELQGVGSFDVDGDDRLDLVALKFELPGIPRLLAAYFLSMSLDLEVLGYRNEGGRKFSRRPTSRNTLSLSLPPLREVLEDIESLADRFIEAAVKRRRFAAGDVDGDGVPDAVFLDEDHVLRVFLARSGEKRLGEVKLGSVLFDAKKKEWELRELLDFVASASHAAARKSLAGRKPDAEVPIGPRYEPGELSLQVRDLNGDRKGEFIIRAGSEKLLVVFR